MPCKEFTKMNLTTLYNLAYLTEKEEDIKTLANLKQIITMISQIEQTNLQTTQNIKTDKKINELRADKVEETIACLQAICPDFDQTTQQIKVPKVIEK